MTSFCFTLLSQGQFKLQPRGQFRLLHGGQFGLAGWGQIQQIFPLESIYVNYFAAKGKKVKVNVFKFFSKKNDIIEVEEKEDDNGN